MTEGAFTGLTLEGSILAWERQGKTTDRTTTGNCIPDTSLLINFDLERGQQ